MLASQKYDFLEMGPAKTGIGTMTAMTLAERKREWKRRWNASPKGVECRRRWNANNPHRVKFHVHKSNAAQRGISFLMTFEDWRDIWQRSGHWHERGSKRGQYCMARFGDKGAYAADNVRICTVDENIAERLLLLSRLPKKVKEKKPPGRRGRPPLFGRAMTAAERQRHHRSVHTPIYGG
jgi:hypothetical protein